MKPQVRAFAYQQDECTLELEADGTVVQTYVWEFYAQGGGTNPLTGAQTSLSSGPQKKTIRGRWNAGGGTLFLVWEDNTWNDYKYALVRTKEGSRLKLTGEKTVQTWQRR